MTENNPERRKYERYDTEVDIYFKVSYDLDTKVDFQKADDKYEIAVSQKYSAISKNVSAEGIAFVCDLKLKLSEHLFLEVYLPNSDQAISMKGEVRWSSDYDDPSQEKELFITGVKLLTIENEPVENSIYYDDKNEIHWSVVLDKILGDYGAIMQKKDKDQS